jgi:hypothetical protein
MTHEIKRSLERSDEPSSSSSSPQRVFDTIREFHANSVQSGADKGKREYNPNTDVPVGEDRKAVEKLQLATSYGKDNPGLAGGSSSSQSGRGWLSQEMQKWEKEQQEKEQQRRREEEQKKKAEDDKRLVDAYHKSFGTPEERWSELLRYSRR